MLTKNYHWRLHLLSKFPYTNPAQNFGIVLTIPLLSFERTNGSSLKMSYGVNFIQIHKKLRLDKRAGSDNWYTRLTLPNGKRLVKTTKAKDIETAKEVALRLYYETDVNVRFSMLESLTLFIRILRGFKSVWNRYDYEPKTSSDSEWSRRHMFDAFRRK